MDELLTPKEAAEALKLSVHTLNGWRCKADSPGPPWINVGGSIRYPMAELKIWIASRMRKGATATSPS
jgi:hypothetical protein